MPRFIRVASVLVALLAAAIVLIPTAMVDARRAPAPAATPIASVIQVQTIPVERAAAVLRSLYPHARIRTDAHANAVIVVASPDDVQAMRTVLQGIDVRNPTQPAVQVVQLKVLKPDAVAGRLRGLYPSASIAVAWKLPGYDDDEYAGDRQSNKYCEYILCRALERSGRKYYEYRHEGERRFLGCRA